jgi:hypothetical protein
MIIAMTLDQQIEAARRDAAFMDRLKQLHLRERALYERLGR